jgi:hypothetical protein
MTQTHDASLRRRLERVARRAEELREMLTRLVEELERIRGIIDDVAFLLEQRETAGAAKTAAPAYSPAEVAMWKREAAAGVARLEVHVQPDGMASVSVNGRPPFLLPPKLRVMLDILSTPGTVADDGLVGWQTRTEVSDALRKRLGRCLGRDDLTRTMFRLRRAFELARDNPYLVQTNREHSSVRFALRADAVRIWQE